MILTFQENKLAKVKIEGHFIHDKNKNYVGFRTTVLSD